MDKKSITEKCNEEALVKKVPILNIRIMSDDEWNRLAYQNYLERKRCLCSE